MIHDVLSAVNYCRYKLSIRFLLTYFSSRTIQKFFYSDTVNEIMLFYKKVSIAVSANDVAYTLLYLYFSKWLSHQMKGIFSDKSLLKKLIRINGEVNYRNAQNESNGIIILASHYGVIECLPFLLLHLGVPKCVIYSRKLLPDFLVATEGVSKINVIALEDNPSSHYEYAESVLKKNGVIVIFADGFYGKKEFKMPFLDKVRGFKVGFTQLALKTEAVMLPVFSELRNDGQIIISIKDRLIYDKNCEFQFSQRSLIKQYSTLLQSYWENDYKHVLYQHKQRYLSFQK